MGLCRYDLSKRCEEKYRGCTDCILDKIRAEIDGLLNDEDSHMYTYGVMDCLEIIDKYRTESEAAE